MGKQDKMLERVSDQIIKKLVKRKEQLRKNLAAAILGKESYIEFYYESKFRFI
jgi:hypothetical protein